MDDANLGSATDAEFYFDEGLPVSFSLNYGRVRTTGPALAPDDNTLFSVSDLLAMKASAEDKGTKIGVADHSLTNWNGFTDSSSYDEILAEVNHAKMKSELGLDIHVYIQPGDASARNFVRRNRQRVLNAIEENGIKYAFGITSMPSGSGYLFDDVSAIGIENSSTAPMDPTNIANGFQNFHGFYPGTMRDPYLFHDTNGSVDLGNYVVHAGNPTGGIPAKDPLFGLGTWMIGEDNEGLGVSGDIVDDWDRMFQVMVYRMLAQGKSFFCGSHGSGRNDNTVISNLSTGRGSSGTPVALPGHWSHPYAAKFLKALQDAGHIKCVTINEFAEYLYSDIPDGMDILANPQLKVPQYDINELGPKQPENPAPRGLSGKHAGYSAHDPNAFPLAPPNSPSSDGKFDTPLSMQDVIGPNVQGSRGRKGGLILKANSDSSYGTVNIRQHQKPAGTYKLSFHVEGHSTGKLVPFDTFIVGTRWIWDSIQNQDPDNREMRAQHCLIRPADYNNRDLNLTTPFANFEFYFECPVDPNPVVSATLNQDPGTVNDAATFTLNTISIADAQIHGVSPTSQIHVVTDELNIPSGVAFEVVSAQINGTDLDVVLQIRNDSGSSWAPGSLEIVVLAEVDEQVNPQRAWEVPISDWIYSWQIGFSKDGNDPVTLNDWKIEYFAPVGMRRV
jgi:hypothetical protein